MVNDVIVIRCFKPFINGISHELGPNPWDDPPLGEFLGYLGCAEPMIFDMG